MPSGKNICNCPHPPGGQATCPDGQLAICRVIGGIAYTECHEPPPGLIFLDTKMNNWALSVIMGTPRSLGQVIGPAEWQILGLGSYVVPGTNDVVTFSLPLPPIGVLRVRPRPAEA